MLERKRILAVDDEPSVRVLISRVLGKAGCAVTTVGSAEEALAELASAPFDLLIVDKNLPRLDGLECLRRAREQDPALPVLLITASPEPGMFRGQRVEAYLRKPFESLHALEEAARQALLQRAREPGAS